MLWPIQLLTYFSRLRSLWRFWQYYCKEKVSSLFCFVVKSQIACDICGTFVGPSSTTHSSSIAEHSSTITESNFSRFFRSGISRQTRASKCTTSSYLHLCVTVFENRQNMSHFDFNLKQRKIEIL